jgi:predicted transposase YdaD
MPRAALQAEVVGTGQESAILDVIAAIVMSRFNGRSIPELCAMGGITLDEFSQSVAYREIFGLGLQEGRQEGLQEGRQEGELEMALRLLCRRCGELSPALDARVRALSSESLEALAEALLDFRDRNDLEAWLLSVGSS